MANAHRRKLTPKISTVVRIIAAGSMFLASLVGQNNTASGDQTHSLAQQQAAAYRKIADRVWSRIEALSERYPHLRTIKTATTKTDASERLWISYHYAHGVSAATNPDYKPGKKSARTIKVFSPDDGIELNLYFFEGAWQGQAAVLPLAIGEMKVVAFIEGRETEAFDSLRGAVMNIIHDEQERFDKEHR